MSHFNLFTYTLVLDEPGQYIVDWQASSATPDIHIYTGVNSFSYVPAQSAYFGATITVVPALGSLTMLAFGALTAPRRRR